MKKNIFKIYALALTSAIGFVSCTDLEIEETDSIIDEGFQGVANAKSAADDLYRTVAGQFSTQADYYAFAEVTSREFIIPTRGTDWGDNGQWSSLHQHTWAPDHNFIAPTFGNWNATQLTASQILDSRSNPSPTDIGDASFIRALSMWVILDLYGQVPFRDTSLPSGELPVVLTGQEAIDFIISDIDTAISNLPATLAASGEANSRASKAAARYLKAKVLLNKHVYLGSSPDAADMNAVVSLVDEIASDGYQLQEGYFDIFLDTPDTETVLAFDNADLGPRTHKGLHYNSFTQSTGGWNGFSTLASFYDTFEGDENQNRLDANGNPLDGQEERRGGVPPAATDTDLVDSNVGNGFLIGQQYSESGAPLTDRADNPLVFTRNQVDNDGNPSIINNNERTGIRVVKWNPKNGVFATHLVVFRYADAHLMKAEAIMRSGGDPTALVNELREIRGASPLTSVSEADLLEERGRELYDEMWARNDEIRFGVYSQERYLKPASDVTRALLPIPPAQLLANPNLVQNPGY